MKHRKIGFIAAAACTLVAAAANAETRIIESKVVRVPAQGSSVTTYKITGPDRVEYFIDAPATEVETINRTIQANPNTVIRFEGEAIQGPRPTFKVSQWRREDHVTENPDGTVSKESSYSTVERTTTR